MKKTIVSLIVMSLLMVTACDKKEDPKPEDPKVDESDKTPPVLVLKGKEKDTLFIGATYNDPGADAMDDKDGDISPFIVVSGTVNTSKAGDYTKDYNVRDAAGNSTKKTRYVNVRNESFYMEGTYNVSCSCATLTTTDPGIYATTSYTTPLQLSLTSNNSFSVGALYLHSTTTLNDVQINRNGVSLSGYIKAGLSPATMSGTVSASNTSFTVNTVVNDFSYPDRQFHCTDVFVKQQ